MIENAGYVKMHASDVIQSTQKVMDNIIAFRTEKYEKLIQDTMKVPKFFWKPLKTPNFQSREETIEWLKSNELDSGWWEASISRSKVYNSMEILNLSAKNVIQTSEPFVWVSVECAQYLK